MGEGRWEVVDGRPCWRAEAGMALSEAAAFARPGRFDAERALVALIEAEPRDEEVGHVVEAGGGHVTVSIPGSWRHHPAEGSLVRLRVVSPPEPKVRGIPCEDVKRNMVHAPSGATIDRVLHDEDRHGYSVTAFDQDSVLLFEAIRGERVSVWDTED